MLGRRLPSGIRIEDVQAAVHRWNDRHDRQTWLRRRRRLARREDRLNVRMLLSHVEVRRPRHRLPRVEHRAEQLILVVIECFGLLRSVGQPVVRGDAIVEAIRRPDTHVVEGQVVEPVRTGIVRLILGVVGLETDRARPLPEVDCETGAERKYVCAVRLKNVAVDPGAGLINRASLQRFRRLAVLEIETSTESPPRGGIGSAFDQHARLVQAEVVARDVVRAQQVDASDGTIEVEAVIHVEAAAIDDVVCEAAERALWRCACDDSARLRRFGWSRVRARTRFFKSANSASSVSIRRNNS